MMGQYRYLFLEEPEGKPICGPMEKQALKLSTFPTLLFLLMGVGIGLSINQSLAVCDGLLRNNKDFIRTPKHGVINTTESWLDKKYRAAKNWVPYLELAMVVYLMLTIAIALTNHHYLSVPFLVLFLTGYIYTCSLSLFQTR